MREPELDAVVRWMRLKDPLATNYLHVADAIHRLNRMHDALAEIASHADGAIGVRAIAERGLGR